jgi:Family of unknown function (DUF6320)
MAICANCGVELDEGIVKCPLCGRITGNSEEQEHLPSNYPSGILHLQKKENRRYLWELSGIIAFSGVAVCTIVDLLINKGLKWSLLSDVSIIASWIILTLFLYTFKRTLILIPGLLITILGALFIIDVVSTGRNWFFSVAFPLTIGAFLVIGLVIFLYRLAHFKGFNVIAMALIAIAGFCIITETFMDKYLQGSVDLRWSLITSISILPVSLILFFYHYRLKKGKRIDSFFHV